MDTEKIKKQIKELEETISGEVKGKRKKIRDLDILLILSWLWQCPLASAKDLEGLTSLKLGKLNNLLQAAVNERLLVRVRIGQTFEVQNWFFLDLKGVYRVMDHFSIPLEWQVTEDGLKRLVQRIRMVEAFYRLMPGLLRSGAMSRPLVFFRNPDPESGQVTTLDHRTCLVGFHWTRRVRHMEFFITGPLRTSICGYRCTGTGSTAGRRPSEI